MYIYCEKGDSEVKGSTLNRRYLVTLKINVINLWE